MCKDINRCLSERLGSRDRKEQGDIVPFVTVNQQIPFNATLHHSHYKSWSQFCNVPEMKSYSGMFCSACASRLFDEVVQLSTKHHLSHRSGGRSLWSDAWLFVTSLSTLIIP